MDHNQTKKLFEDWNRFINEAEARTPEKFKKELEKLVLNAESESPDTQLILSKLKEMESFVQEMNAQDPNNLYNTVFRIKKQEIDNALRSNSVPFVSPRKGRKGSSIGVDRTSYLPGARKRTREIERMQALNKAAVKHMQVHGTGTTYDLKNRKKIVLDIIPKILSDVSEVPLFLLGLSEAEDFDSIDWAIWVAFTVIPLGFAGRILNFVLGRSAAKVIARQATPAIRKLGKAAAKDKRLVRRLKRQERNSVKRIKSLQRSASFRFLNAAVRSRLVRALGFLMALYIHVITARWTEKTIRSMYSSDDLRSLDREARKEYERKLKNAMQNRQAAEAKLDKYRSLLTLTDDLMKAQNEEDTNRIINKPENKALLDLTDSLIDAELEAYK